MNRPRRRQAAPDNNVIPLLASEVIDIADIQPYERNPRDNTDAIKSVANSIRAFGFSVPVIVDKDGVLIAGHTRFEAAKTLGMTAVTAIRAEHLTEEQANQFRIIDNKVAEAARWDMDLLAGEISALRESGIDFTQFGFSAEEIDCLSDMVQEDCLSALGMNEDGSNDRRPGENRRAPAQARFVLSEFVFFIPTSAYKRWAQATRTEQDFDEKAITKELQDRLGITPYLEAED